MIKFPVTKFGFYVRSFAVKTLRLYEFSDFKYVDIRSRLGNGIPFAFLAKTNTFADKLFAHTLERRRKALTEFYAEGTIECKMSKALYEAQLQLMQPYVCATVMRTWRLGPFTKSDNIVVFRRSDVYEWRTFLPDGRDILTASYAVEALENNFHKQFIDEQVKLTLDSSNIGFS